MIFPLEVTASGEKFVSCIVSSEEYYCLNFAIYCVCWCYFYTVKQQPCRRINNLIIKFKKIKKIKNLASLYFSRTTVLHSRELPTSAIPESVECFCQDLCRHLPLVVTRIQAGHSLILSWASVLTSNWPPNQNGTLVTSASVWVFLSLCPFCLSKGSCSKRVWTLDHP